MDGNCRCTFGGHLAYRMHIERAVLHAAQIAASRILRGKSAIFRLFLRIVTLLSAPTIEWHHLRSSASRSRRVTVAGDENKSLIQSWSAVGSHGQYRPQAVCGRYDAWGPDRWTPWSRKALQNTAKLAARDARVSFDAALRNKPRFLLRQAARRLPSTVRLFFARMFCEEKLNAETRRPQR